MPGTLGYILASPPVVPHDPMRNPPQPIKLSYAAPTRRAAERAAALFTFVAVVAVLGSGSVAWALLMGHR